MAQYHQALDAFFKGDPVPAERLYSHEDDVTLANPFGPPVVGWDAVRGAMERAAANYSDGAATRFDRLASRVTPELAYLVELERFSARLGGAPQRVAGELRATTVLRPENGEWRIVHRHADPITTPRRPDSVAGG